VPLPKGGTPVTAQILLVNFSEREAKESLWRREINK